ncbi:MAG: EAL domain-containing protein [Pseudomonadota bacterium]
MKSKLSLAQRYAIYMGSIAFALLFAMFLLQVYQLQQTSARISQESQRTFAAETVRQLRQRGVVLAETLAHNVTEPYLAMDMVSLYDLIVPVRRSTSVESVFFFDANGRILHDGTREIAMYDQDVRTVFPNIRPQSGESDVLVLSRSIAVVRPVRSELQLHGGVVVELSTAGVDESHALLGDQLNELTDNSVRTSVLELGVIGLVLVVVLSLVAMLAGKRLAEPVKRLGMLADRLGKGDYDARVGFRRDDEIGDLAQSFDQMRQNLKEQNQRIEFQAYFDELTGLRNRASFHQLMSDVFVNGHPDAQHVLVYIDIDGFKRVNDGLGHGAGDRLLKAFAQRLRTWSTDVNGEPNGLSVCNAARWGGDQFVLLLRDVADTTIVSPMARNLLGTLGQPVDIAGMDVVLSSSVGYAVYPHDAKDSDTLMSYADLAMYTSKERGTNLVSAYTHRVNERVELNLLMESELRLAIEEEQFELKYMPIADTTSRVVTGFEQLVVWNHPERGELKPKHFMTALVSAGLREKFREWGFFQGLADLRRWHDAGFDHLRLHYNLASLDFDPRWLSEILLEGLEREQIDSRDISFEISEQSFSKNMLLTAELLRDLGVYDVSLWIDSFGTGYTSLNRLRRMSVTGIKLHHSVVRGVNRSQDNQHLVAASIAMAHGLGLLAAADGVFDEGQLSFLRQKGCDAVQGPLVGEPIIAASVEAYLRNYSSSHRFKRSS